jgi:hypothetical protein
MSHIYSQGDKVSVERWDADEPPYKRLGSPAEVVMTENVRNCESGVMVTVRGANKGEEKRLDSNWLLPLDKTKPAPSDAG